MDYHREKGFSGGNVVQVLSGDSRNNLANENWAPDFSDQAVWATEDDYGMWNNTESSFDNNSNSNYDDIPSQSNEPPNKRSKGGDSAASNRSKAIGKMFYKTKLCCKFRAGTCPYITNCNFAHSVEELRKPPPNWQEIVADNQEPREEYQIPILGVGDDNNNNQRSFKGRHCKKFYTEEGCPYGESCTFLHDEHSRARESVAISLGPGGYGGGNGSGTTVIKPSNWKTRICNKWEITGYCPFGNKCHFAHGSAELHRFGGGPMDSEVKDTSTADAKKGAAHAKTSVDTVVASIPHSDGYHIGVQSQRPSNAMQKSGPRSTQKWKGPDKISKIYGDWIDDFE